MVKKKAQSKRVSLRVRDDTKKKVREHARKAKKFANRNPEKAALLRRMRETQRATSGIPASHPYKDRLLAQVEAARQKRDEAVQQKKQDRKDRRKQNVLAARLMAQAEAMPGADMAAMVTEAGERAEAFEEREEEEEDGDVVDAGLGQQSRRAYMRELKKVVHASDVVLHVLDARDPLGSFSVAMEDAVRRHHDKKLVLLLNKADLVPKEVLQAWLEHLRRRAPTVAFKASTSESSGHLQQLRGDAARSASAALRSPASVGTEQLLSLLKNYGRSGGVKRSIAVGVVGYPNVGKSSVINSLKRSRAVSVSAVAGHTRSMQEVNLDAHLRLLDSPGVVFADGDAADVALRNVVDPDVLEDPLRAAEAILARVPRPFLQAKYALPAACRASDTAFFAALGRRLGRVKRGGVPDREAAARALLRDWNAARIPFYTTVPQAQHGAGLEAEDQLLTGLADGVDGTDLAAADAETLAALGTGEELDMVEVAAPTMPEKSEYRLWGPEAEDAEDAMEEAAEPE